VLRFAYHQAQLRQRPLTVLVATTTPPHAVPPGEAGVEAARERLAESVADLAERYPDVAATLEVCRGTPAECLLTVADSMDLVVVGHHERGILGRYTHGSVAVAVLEHASVAVAIVPLDASSLARSH
jgi:nucleotide-binding universal stress UspA family protein